MKKMFLMAGCVGVVIYGIWLFGIVGEFEYPYLFTLMRVRSADSADGVPVVKIITADGADWSGPGLAYVQLL